MSNKNKTAILDMAIQHAKADGYQNIRREKVAAALGISCGLVNYHFSTMKMLQRAVMGAAIAQRIPEIVAQGMAAKDPRASHAPEDLKVLARASLI
jgi:AcrR family transcriptional regulator